MIKCYCEGLEPTIKLAEILEQAGYHSIKLVPEATDIYKLETNEAERT